MWVGHAYISENTKSEEIHLRSMLVMNQKGTCLLIGYFQPHMKMAVCFDWNHAKQ